VVIDAMKTSSLRIVVLVAIIAPSLVLHPTMARAATVTVMVGNGGFYGGFVFTPSSVTIHTGDSVLWTWASSGHSSTSGSPGMPSGLWDSGILNQGATFMQTFNTAGSFSYYCTQHGACCGMVGSVTVVGAVGATGIGLVEVFKLPSASRLANISTRLNVLTGDNVLIGGFIIGGPGNKKVVLRAIGPSLSNPPFNLSGVLADPTIELHDGTGTIIATNDNWKDTQQADIAATGLAPTNDFESAILQTLAPGAYTAIVRGKNGGTGVGLVEAYDADPSVNAELTNISTRGSVGTGDNVMIGGFIVGGGGSATVVVRAIGPSLSNPPFNLSGVLQDPTLSLFDANGVIIVSNDNWKDTQQAELQATGLAPTDDHESAILVTLPAGGFTVIVRGK
jgi:plastocyanin